MFKEWLLGCLRTSVTTSVVLSSTVRLVDRINNVKEVKSLCLMFLLLLTSIFVSILNYSYPWEHVGTVQDHSIKHLQYAAFPSVTSTYKQRNVRQSNRGVFAQKKPCSLVWRLARSQKGTSFDVLSHHLHWRPRSHKNRERRGWTITK